MSTSGRNWGHGIVGALVVAMMVLAGSCSSSSAKPVIVLSCATYEPGLARVLGVSSLSPFRSPAPTSSVVVCGWTDPRAGVIDLSVAERSTTVTLAGLRVLGEEDDALDASSPAVTIDGQPGLHGPPVLSDGQYIGLDSVLVIVHEKTIVFVQAADNSYPAESLAIKAADYVVDRITG